MKEGEKSGIMKAVVVGSVIFALILMGGTYWSGKSASRDTEQAVRNVSLLYLDELAGRREQVVSSAISDYLHNVDNALGVLNTEAL